MAKKINVTPLHDRVIIQPARAEEKTAGGIIIPDTIAVVGFNNDAIGKLIEPALTTINYPGMDMGEIAARNLVNHLKGISNIHQTNTIIVRSDLIIRNSSLKKGILPQ